MAALQPEVTHWLDDALRIHRQVLLLAPGHALLERELAVALFQRGQQRSAADDLRESFELLRGLHARGALEARYVPSLQALEKAFGSS